MAALLLLLSCASNKPAPPHVHEVKWLIAQGVETDGVAQYGYWYACCECGAECVVDRATYEALVREQEGQ